jgi:general secretion pathway protein M
MNELTQRWNALAARERGLAAAAVALIVLALLWWVAISPALSKLRAAQEAAPKLQAQVQLMRAQANEAANLKAQRVLSYDESLRALESSIKTLGAGATLSVSNERATVILKAVNADALALMLSQVRANARLVPAQVKLQQSAGSSADTTAWDGQLVLNLPAR